MIQQQYYTRERGGLFNQSDGYDSIAKSEGLTLDFIKKYIHPICNYDIPSELQKTGETDETKYPENFIVMPLNQGEMLVGQASYKSKDFTGLRSTFFMHNYILSEKEKLEMIKTPAKLFGITYFANTYDISLGKELPTLSSIPFKEDSMFFTNREQFLGQIGVTEQLFKKMLYATYVAATSKKKVYICLDVPIEQLNTYAKALLYHLYKNLPRIVLKDLGVSTYSRTPEAKKNLHIMFVEKGSIRYGDSKIDKEFVFDFSHKKFLNVDSAVENNAYFKVAMKYAESTKAWDLFNDFIQDVTLGMTPHDAKSLELHNKLAVLFEMELHRPIGQDYDLSNLGYRQGLLSALLSYIERPIDDETKKRLSHIMDYAIKCVMKEVGKGLLLGEDEVNVMLKYNIKGNPIELMNDLLLDIKEALKLKNAGHITKVLSLVSKEDKVYREFFNLMYSDKDLREKVCYKVVRDVLSESRNLEKLIKAMDKLSDLESVLAQDNYYKELVKKYFTDCLHKEENKVQLLARIQSWCEPKRLTLYEELLYQGEVYVLEHLNLNTLTSEETLIGMRFKHVHKKLNYEVIECYKRLKNHSFDVNEDKQVLTAVQKLIKKFYKSGATAKDFYMIEYAFAPSMANLQEVFKYLYQISTDQLLDFIIWAKEQTGESGQNIFDKQVVVFFKTLKEKGEKIPKETIKNKLESRTKTELLYVKIRDSQQPKWLKFIRHNPKLMLCYSILLVVIIGTVTGGYIVYNKMNEPNNIPVPTPQVAQDMLIEKGVFFTQLEIEEILKEK